MQRELVILAASAYRSLAKGYRGCAGGGLRGERCGRRPRQQEQRHSGTPAAARLRAPSGGCAPPHFLCTIRGAQEKPHTVGCMAREAAGGGRHHARRPGSCGSRPDAPGALRGRMAASIRRPYCLGRPCAASVVKVRMRRWCGRAGVSLADGLDPAVAQFSAFLRHPGGGGGAGGPQEALRRQAHAVGCALLHRRQLGLVPGLVALAASLGGDPALQLLEASAPAPAAGFSALPRDPHQPSAFLRHDTGRGCQAALQFSVL